ncbi:MAG: serine hydrolase domain-containing protein, partial [Candidatus Hodarchaeales archaeon]
MNKNLLKTNILRLGLGLVLVILINQSFIPSLSIQQLEKNYWPTEGWQLSTPKGMNMSQSRLNDMIAYIEEQEFAIDSILIVKNGYIVFEEYLNPTQNESTLHPIFSCTKSYLSAFIGLAIEKGYFESIDQKIFDFFPNQTYSNPDPRKQNITIQHLLTMTSGLEWTEWDLAFTDPNNDLAHLIDSSNWVQYILDKPMATNPGTVFNYNTGDFHLLSALLMNATAAQNVSIENFLVDSFGVPMGSSGFGWEVDPQRIPTGGTGIHASIREMAKFGLLYLNNGTWDDKQVIPKEWITLSTS